MQRLKLILKAKAQGKGCRQRLKANVKEKVKGKSLRQRLKAKVQGKGSRQRLKWKDQGKGSRKRFRKKAQDKGSRQRLKAIGFSWTLILKFDPGSKTRLWLGSSNVIILYCIVVYEIRKYRYYIVPEIYLSIISISYH